MNDLDRQPNTKGHDTHHLMCNVCRRGCIVDLCQGYIVINNYNSTSSLIINDIML